MQRLEQLNNTELFELLGEYSIESVMAQEILDNRMEIELI
jgi:hypothetical protein